MKMSIKFYGFIILILGASVIGEKIPVLKYTNITTDIKPENPYFDKGTDKISELGDTFSLSCPIKLLVSENMMFRLDASVNGSQVLLMEMKVCEGLDSGVVDQNILDHAYPKGEFPTSCPIKANNYELRDYKFSVENIPFGIPEGDFVVNYSLFEPDGEPLAWIILEGIVTYV